MIIALLLLLAKTVNKAPDAEPASAPLQPAAIVQPAATEAPIARTLLQAAAEPVPQHGQQGPAEQAMEPPAPPPEPPAQPPPDPANVPAEEGPQGA